jgi:glycosyltransferase involved in cell wall biosynthesis
MTFHTSAGPVSAPSLGFVSTYPPTKCGLATFTHSLVDAMSAGRERGRSIGVVRVVNRPHDSGLEAVEVVCRMDPARPESLVRALGCLNQFDVAIVQHEFGIFGADDGVAVLELLQSVEVPVIATLHTVPPAPTARQRDILAAIVEMVDVPVVMSQRARISLERAYPSDPGSARVVPHGAHGYPSVAKPPGGRPVILTWGLIGPGKGIEWGIRALPALRELDPPPLYRVCGATHPNVLRTEGERYRDSVLALARRLGVEDMLEVRGEYLDHDALSALVGSADIVLLPYDSREQATSGVLIDAVAAGKPVVSTRFPHAVELLAGGAGHVVPHQEPGAIAEALTRLLEDRVAYQSARERARNLAHSLAWPTVASHYERLAAQIAYRRSTQVA